MDNRATVVYDLFLSNPGAVTRGYLHDHYARGLENVMKPDASAIYAHAAWRAGRVTAERAELERERSAGDGG